MGPVGEFTRALEEARSMLDPWARECAKFESLKDFQTLVELGYDTPGYTVRWWEPTYWRYWASGDAICAALGMGDFGDDVLPAYQKVRAPRDQWLGQVEAAEANVARVHELVRTHDHSVDRLARLPQIYLDEARKLLVKHLTMADASLLSTWAGDDRGIVMALRTVGGLQAKIDFLDDAAERGLTAFIMEMEHRRDKYRRKVQKYRRPKRTRRLIPDSELDRKFSTKLPKYYARADKLEKMADRVSNYDQYDRFELDNPPSSGFTDLRWQATLAPHPIASRLVRAQPHPGARHAQHHSRVAQATRPGSSTSGVPVLALRVVSCHQRSRDGASGSPARHPAVGSSLCVPPRHHGRVLGADLFRGRHPGPETGPSLKMPSRP